MKRPTKESLPLSNKQKLAKIWQHLEEMGRSKKSQIRAKPILDFRFCDWYILSENKIHSMLVAKSYKCESWNMYIFVIFYKKVK